MSNGDVVLSIGTSAADLRLVGPALRLLRQESGLAQNEVANRAGITKAMLSSYETGKVLPTFSSLMAVLRELRSDLRRFQDTLDRLQFGASLDLRPDSPSPVPLECEVERAVLQIVARLTRIGKGGNQDAYEFDDAPEGVGGEPE